MVTQSSCFLVWQSSVLGGSCTALFPRPHPQLGDLLAPGSAVGEATGSHLAPLPPALSALLALSALALLFSTAVCVSGGRQVLLIETPWTSLGGGMVEQNAFSVSRLKRFLELSRIIFNMITLYCVSPTPCLSPTVHSIQ